MLQHSLTIRTRRLHVLQAHKLVRPTAWADLADSSYQNHRRYVQSFDSDQLLGKRRTAYVFPGLDAV